MLTKLLPDQVATFWPVIKYAIEEALPPNVSRETGTMNRILSSCLSGELEVWVSYKRTDNKFDAVLVTQFLYDIASDTKNLLLYALYGYSIIREEGWMEGGEALVKYAKSKGCKQIVSYTSNQHLVEFAKKYGCNTEFTFISLQL